MIRRNHIEKVTPIDRRYPKFEEREPNRQSNSNRYTVPKQIDVTIDDSNRVTSSNKKYHQYKDWKQQNKNKIIPKQLQDSKKKGQNLSQFSNNENPQINHLKRQYQINNDQNKYESKISSTRYKLTKNTENSNNSNILENYSYTRPHLREIQDQQPSLRTRYETNSFYGVSIQNQGIKQSPDKGQRNYQSIKKYQQQSKYSSNTKSYIPLFDYVSSQIPELPRKQRRAQVRSTVKNTGKIVYYDNSMKSSKQGPTFRDTNINTFNLPQNYQRSTNIQASICSSGLPVRQGIVQNGNEQVSSKLKKISQFNDQINERIKNIIVCFESLKSKL